MSKSLLHLTSVSPSVKMKKNGLTVIAKPGYISESTIEGVVSEVKGCLNSILTLPLTVFESLGLTVSVAQFPHHRNGNNKFHQGMV